VNGDILNFLTLFCVRMASVDEWEEVGCQEVGCRSADDPGETRARRFQPD